MAGTMTAEEMTAKLQEALGEQLRGVVLYGSAAAGDTTGKRSDVNLLVLVDRLGVPELQALFGPTRSWAKQGNPPPLLFTEARLRESVDVFPIEMLDIRDQHRVLAGENPLAGLTISGANLRHQIEHELKGKLIALREHYLLTQGKAAAVRELLIASIANFQVLARAALRLVQKDIPGDKAAATKQLAERLEIDLSAFAEVAEVKRGDRKADDPNALFARYLTAVEALVDAVDGLAATELTEA
jgi:hypothetical protein